MHVIVKMGVLRSAAISTVQATSAMLALGAAALLSASSPAAAGCGVVSHPTGAHSAVVGTGVKVGVSSGTSTATSLPSCGSTYTGGGSMHVSAVGAGVATIPKGHAVVGRSEHTAQALARVNSAIGASHTGFANKTHEKPKT